MTFESNQVIAIAAHRGWLKNLVSVFGQAKPKPIAPCTRNFSRTLNTSQAIAGNSDCFMTLILAVVIVRSNYLRFFFSFNTHITLQSKMTKLYFHKKKVTDTHTHTHTHTHTRL